MDKKAWSFLRTISIIITIAASIFVFYWFGYRLNGEFVIRKKTFPQDDPLVYIFLLVTAGGILFSMFAHTVIQNNRVDKQTITKAITRLVVLVAVIALVRWLLLS